MSDRRRRSAGPREHAPDPRTGRALPWGRPPRLAWLSALAAGLLVAAPSQADRRPGRPPRPLQEQAGEASDRPDVPAGTQFGLRLRDTLSTATSRPGDRFRAEVAGPVRAGGEVALPAGAVVEGEVTRARKSGSAREAATLRMAFETVRVEGRRYPIQARLIGSRPVMRSRLGTVDRVLRIGGGAALGAAVGGFLGGGPAAVAGGAVGGVAAVVWVVGFQDVDAVLPAGSEIRVRLERPLRFRRPLPPGGQRSPPPDSGPGPRAAPPRRGSATPYRVSAGPT